MTPFFQTIFKQRGEKGHSNVLFLEAAFVNTAGQFLKKGAKEELFPIECLVQQVPESNLRRWQEWSWDLAQSRRWRSAGASWLLKVSCREGSLPACSPGPLALPWLSKQIRILRGVHRDVLLQFSDNTDSLE